MNHSIVAMYTSNIMPEMTGMSCAIEGVRNGENKFEMGYIEVIITCDTDSILDFVHITNEIFMEINSCALKHPRVPASVRDTGVSACRGDSVLSFS